MKIVLAVDLNEIENHKDPLIYEELHRWSNSLKTDVLPIFIDTSPKNSIFSDPNVLMKATAPLSSFAELTVLHLPEASRKQEIESLLAFAKEQKADLVSLISQGKATLEKQLIGSFAETLLLKSELPLLFLEEEVRIKNKFNRVVFATDFSEASKEAFLLLLKHLQNQDPEIIIFNAIQLPQFTATGPVYAHAIQVLPQNYWNEQLVQAEARGANFVSLAKKQGLKARLEIANQVFSVENTIHELARREKVRLVAMVSVSSPTQRFLLGSISRSILRTRIKPIWLCGPNCLSQSDI